MKLSTSQIPLIINVESHIFIEAYKKAKKNKCIFNIEKTLTFLKPAFLHWQYVFNGTVPQDDINIYTLFLLLKADDRPKGDLSWKINTYKEYLRFNSLTLVDELNECFLQHINKKYKRVYPNYPKVFRLLFYLAKEIKMFLFKKIRKVLANVVRNNNYLIPINNDYTVDNYLVFYDYDNDLHHSVFILLLNNHTVKDISIKLNLTQKKTKEIICQLANQMLLSS